MVIDKDFESSQTEVENFESKEDLKHPEEYEDGGMNIPDDLNREKNDPRIQALFKRSRHNKSSIFIISQDYYEFQNRTIRANGSIFREFEANKYRYAQNPYQDKTSTDLAANEFEYLTSNCCVETNQTLTIDMTEDENTGRYRLGLNSFVVPITNRFKTL